MMLMLVLLLPMGTQLCSVLLYDTRMRKRAPGWVGVLVFWCVVGLIAGMCNSPFYLVRWLHDLSES
jgi:hypothetical protein